MGNCKDCVFWKYHVDQWKKEWNQCEKASDAHRAYKPKDDGFFVFAEASDDSGLWAGLVTGPMFGCVNFTAIKSV
jgi:hypothetical protein